MGTTSGTVTFLFTDVEGSTRLWQLDDAAMRAAIAQHDAILQSIVAKFGGTVFATMGDGVAAVFPSAPAGLTAAREAQVRLSAEGWPTEEPIRVRMGLHSGEADVREGDYFGTSVNRAARIMAIAHGGQILCSGVTAGLVIEQLPIGTDLVDLGAHRLRDLSVPEQIHQVVVEGLNHDFPRVRSLDTLPGNLPVQPTAFVGREREVKELVETILSARVVTLTGVGGVGKTRLALQAAGEVLPSFRDGSWLVELAGVGSADAVQDAVASTLGIPGGGPSSMRGLDDYFRSKEMLLIIDNCEHLLSPVSNFVDRLIRIAPEVRVLATSREGLGVEGEHLWAVVSLELPDPAGEPAAILATDAVRLFVERAREAHASYRWADDDAAAVAELCCRLDGIPLAIELAAARVPAFTPAEIAAHLDRRFRLLTGGRRSALPRHQTLRNAIEWSYQLLGSEERVVLQRLSVFVGDFDLLAAQAVTSSDEVDALDVLDLLVRLVAKSLVVAEPSGGSTRYRLLETVRDFAWEHLTEGQEVETVSRRHAEFYAAFARDAGSGLKGPDEAVWRERLETDLDNLRAALAWAISAGDANLALEPVADLAVFGDRITPYGLLPEDAARIDEDHVLTPVALGATCFAASLQGDAARAMRLATEARRRADALDRSLRGLWVRCRVANGSCMAIATHGGDDWLDFGRQWLSDARELGDDWSLCEALTFTVALPDLDQALKAGEEALALARKLRSPSRVSFAAVLLAGRLAESDPSRVEALLAESAEAATIARNDWADFTSPTAVGLLQIRAGDRLAAAATLVEAIERWTARGLPGTTMQFVSLLACLLHTLADNEGALVLAAWAEERGMEVVSVSDVVFWNPYGADDFRAFCKRVSAAETERAARASRALDDLSLAQYARGRLTRLHTERQ